MSAISFREAAIRSEIPVEELNKLATSGHIKTVQNYFTVLVDSDSLDTYLVNRVKPVVQQEMIIKREKEISMSETVNSPTGTPVDKVTRYGWTVKDEMGHFMKIKKHLLVIDTTYQRTAALMKVRGIQSSWSWIAFCCIPVAHRNGLYYVIDGQHRVLAAMNRSDIKELPCMVFESTSVEDEARGFLNTNILRKPIASIDSFKARIIAGDEEALYISRILQFNSIAISKHADKARSIASIAACFKMAEDSRPHFEKVISLASELCADCPVQAKLVEGLFYLSKHLTTDLTDTRLRKRILHVGASNLVVGANKAVAYHDAGGARIYAAGMLDAINSGLRQRYKCSGDDQQ